MHFHCMTWMHNTEEWAELEHDATWSALANKFATTVSPIIRSKAVMYTDAIKNYLIGLHGRDITKTGFECDSRFFRDH